MAELIADQGMDGGKLLQTSHAPEPLHRPLTLAERKVRVLGPIVDPRSHLAVVTAAKIFVHRTVAAQPINDYNRWPTVTFHRFISEFSAADESRVFVTKLQSTSPSWSTAQYK